MLRTACRSTVATQRSSFTTVAIGNSSALHSTLRYHTTTTTHHLATRHTTTTVRSAWANTTRSFTSTTAPPPSQAATTGALNGAAATTAKNGGTWQTMLAMIAGAGLVTVLLNLPAARKLVSREEPPLESLQKLFSKYANTEGRDGQRYMTREDFITSLVPQTTNLKQALAQDSFRDILEYKEGESLISFSDFVLFDLLSSTSEDQLATAFRLFDDGNDGYLNREEFRRVMAAIGGDTGLSAAFNLNNAFWRRFFEGKHGQDSIHLSELTRIYRSLKEDILLQEFIRFDPEGTGEIAASDFANTLVSNTPSKDLPSHVIDRLRSVSAAYRDAKVNFEEFYNFNSFITRLDDVESGLQMCSAAMGQISKDDFKRLLDVATDSAVTPLQCNIIFHLFDNPKVPGTLDANHFLTSLRYRKDRRLFDLQQLAVIKEKVPPLVAMVKAVESFALGGVAGAIGATFVYPIDLVKTRMQNQRTPAGAAALAAQGKPVYKNSWDCAGKVYHNEGLRGFYRGLGPQLIGVAPEKAIKLVVNDYLRSWFQTPGKPGEVYFPLEVLAGAGAGASQVVFTNPLEIVKIRLQVQGEVKGAAPKSALTIVKELGFAGLYKGASACFLRDIPFSGIYFPAYASFKEMLKVDGRNTHWDLLLAGSIAGVFAASSTTPADVVKTRLQVEARTGEARYNGIVDCFAKVYAAEGPTAFFKGVMPRVFRSSPQFGVTLLSYEMLQELANKDGRMMVNAPPTNVPVNLHDVAGGQYGEPLRLQVASARRDEDAPSLDAVAAVAAPQGQKENAESTTK
eukprot:TRINITY_DN6880_c0_g1_i1.p1 TRINITY_DN6880_c0_g1~~TRINITY_DN6880_c0_g1_i1.p1  ORF type:complete len:796 (+),score=160.15 TRINITY_DN6880_c0_g1_i1:164-2551(+)